LLEAANDNTFWSNSIVWGGGGMSLGSPGKSIKKPELIDLPVYRDKFISQQRVDELYKLFWNADSDITIRDLAEEHLMDRRFNISYHDHIESVFDRITKFFREKEKGGEIEPLSYIAMVDLLYEIDRRVRISSSMDDFMPQGHPDVPTPDSDRPAMDSSYYEVFKNIEPYKNSGRFKSGPTEGAKKHKVWGKLLKEHPEVIFASIEASRRYIHYYELNPFLYKANAEANEIYIQERKEQK
jgi:hypothetical protein